MLVGSISFPAAGAKPKPAARAKQERVQFARAPCGVACCGMATHYADHPHCTGAESGSD